MSKDYTIEVIAVPDLSAESVVDVEVDPTKEIKTSVNDATEKYNFKTINQALQFIKLAKVSDEAYKNLYLMPNTIYHEKVEFDMPNMNVMNSNLENIQIEDLTYDNVKTIFATFPVIEYDILAGYLDPSETITYSTNGSATVSVRPEATGFTAQGITFKNYYNTSELFKESLKITTDTQAVACLVQADQAEFIGCYFTSYQDTLYAQIGRQAYVGCLIEGHTDYIFGYNAPVYISQSIIRSIGDGADPNTNSNYNNGGYVVATKGFNKNVETDGIEFGYIFDECQFIADEATAAGSVSIARAWDKNMRIVIMNSKLDGHISKEAYLQVTADGKDMNDRYGKMNATPNADYLIECNNFGDGAIQASLADTCTVVNDSSKYTPNALFDAHNGKLVFNASWLPSFLNESTEVITILNYDINETTGAHDILGDFRANVDQTITLDAVMEVLIQKIPAGKQLEGLYTSDGTNPTNVKFDFANTKVNRYPFGGDNQIFAKFIDKSSLVASSTISDELAVTTSAIAADLAWGTTGLITIKGGKCTVDANSKKITKVDGTEVSTTNRLKTNGAGQKIEIDLSAFTGSATIEVWAITSSANALDRGFKVLDATGAQVGPNYMCTDGAKALKFTFTLTCGQAYTLENIVGAINYYGINIKPAA